MPRFIMGVSAGEDPGATGGSTSHGHTVASHYHSVDPPGTSTSTNGSHYHSSVDVDPCNFPIGCTDVANDTSTGNHSHSVNIGTFNSGSAVPGTSSPAHLPPYFELAFLMKLPY
jgi:hypothetical protein